MIGPYYQDECVTIYHGDCREVLPGLEYDAVVTDPPYGTGKYAHDVAVLTPELLGILASVPVAVFGYPERLIELCVASGRVPDEWVTWWATNAAAKAPCITDAILPRESECIAVFGRGSYRQLRRPRTGTFRFDPDKAPAGNNFGGFKTRTLTDDARIGDVWRDASPGVGFQYRNRRHPNEKAVGVMGRMVQALSQEADTVLDPFMGSGTTLVAARDLGRRAIGIEIDKVHCETAAARLSQGVLV